MRRLSTLIVLTMTCFAASGREVGGMHLDDQITVRGANMILNGAGIRKKFGIVSVYAAGLYLVDRHKTAADLVGGTQASRIVLVMMRALEPESLLDALHEALRANTSGVEAEAIKPQLLKLDGMLREHKIREKDSIALDIEANGTVEILFNGQTLGSLAGPEIGPALLKIWLGSKPVQESLKAELLGG